MNSILFVDDEPQVLDGLRDALRRKRKAWHMQFAEGGEAALRVLAAGPVDVIVSDMRMPGMDGAALLDAVRERYPAVTRMVLSGHAERDQLTRAIGIAHQYLCKPCDGAVLIAAIERVLEARARSADPRVLELVGRIGSLPVAQGTYRRLSAAIARGDVRLDLVGAILEEDPGLAAKTLQLANSAFFGLKQPLSSIREAVQYLGFEQIRALVLTAQVFSAVDRSVSIAGFDVERWQAHSLATARLARALVMTPDQRDEAFAAGLLHDVGIFVLALGMPEALAAAFHRVANSHARLPEIELEVIGITHAGIGAYFAGTWGLPNSVMLAIATHHETEAPEGVASLGLSTPRAVQVANLLQQEPAVPAGRTPEQWQVRLSELGVPGDRRASVIEMLAGLAVRGPDATLKLEAVHG